MAEVKGDFAAYRPKVLAAAANRAPNCPESFLFLS
jgi:hypothetical protein